MKDFLTEYAKQILIGVSLVIAGGFVTYFIQKLSEKDSLENQKIDLEKIKFKSKHNGRFNFSIEIPENWDKTVSPTNNDGFIFCEPIENICITASGIASKYFKEDGTIEPKDVISDESDFNKIKIISFNKVEWEEIISESKSGNALETVPLPGSRVIYSHYDNDRKEERIVIEIDVESDEFHYSAVCSCPENIFLLRRELMMKTVNSLKIYNSDEATFWQ